MFHKVRAIQRIAPGVLSKIRNAVAAQFTLSDAIRWISSFEQPDAICDSIAQDEYTFDIIVRYASDVFLVYDVS